jgi:thiosulfate/3-mercaptopyruvate sulfurtransferase
MPETLAQTELLAAHLGDLEWAIFDCRSVLTDSDAGPKRYAESHIPGAHYLHLDTDLAGPVTPDTGRHPLPDPERLAAVLGRAGLDANTQVVAYDDAGGAHAARLWWLMRWLGHRQVAVLDGGWQRWLQQGHAVTAELPQPEPRRFTAAVQAGMWTTTAEVLELVRGRKRRLLMDARGASRYRGDEEPIDPVAGHVPGALNLPFTDNLAADGRFKAPALLAERFEQALAGLSSEQAISMCGSGVTACHNLLAMEIAGLKGGRLYAGSWSEWIRDAARPVARAGQA